jgi:hypothetical protein
VMNHADLPANERHRSDPTQLTCDSWQRLIHERALASKVICDDMYSNKSWCIAGQGMFTLREINQMEWEMCSYLGWQLKIKPGAPKVFISMVQKDSMVLDPTQLTTRCPPPLWVHSHTYEQYPNSYPILWSRRTSISPVDVLHSSFGETVVKVVGQLVPDANGSPPASYSCCVPFECPLPSQFDVSCHTTQLRG